MEEIDTVAPVLTALNLPSSVDVRGGDQGVAFNVGATDGGTGVAFAEIRLDKPLRIDGGGSAMTFGFYGIDPFDDADGRTTYFRLDSSTVAGTYNVVSALVRDEAGNATIYDGAQLAALGFRTSFTVDSTVRADQPDTIAPVLTFLDLPAEVDVTDGGGEIKFAVGATDEGSGVDRVEVVYDKDWRVSLFTSDRLVANDSSGDSFSDGRSSGSSFINKYWSTGPFNVQSVSVFDRAGNETVYTPSQLTAMGVRTTFSLVDRNPGTSPVITAPTSVTEGVDESAVISILLRGVTQFFGTVTMAFDQAGSTVANGVDVAVPDYSMDYGIYIDGPGDLLVRLPPIAILADRMVEGTETISVRIRVPGQTFASGTDTVVVAIPLKDAAFTGTDGADTLTATAGDDVLVGLAGDDRLAGGLGNDRIVGGVGVDTAVFGSFHRQATVSRDGVTTTVRSGDGTDTLSTVERFEFADGRYVLDADSDGARVQRLYDAVLNRGPDQAGLEFWLDAMNDRGLTLSQVGVAFLSSPEFQQAGANVADDGAFVDFLYGRTLGRTADAGGRAFWVDKLASGQSRGDVLLDFSESAEHRARAAAVTDKGYFETDDAYQAAALLYDAFADRAPDAAGLGYWAEELKSGRRGLGEVADQFAASAEFQGRTASLSNGQLVDYMYQNALGRAPDAAGRSYWTGRLDAGLTDGGLLYEFAFTPEHEQSLLGSIIGGVTVL